MCFSCAWFLQGENGQDHDQPEGDQRQERDLYAEEDLIVIGARRAGRCAGLDALRENSSVEAQMPKCDGGPTKGERNTVAADPMIFPPETKAKNDG